LPRTSASDAAVRPRDQDGREPRIDVAHGQHPARAAGEVMDLDPDQVRVPGDVDVLGQQGLYLAIVIEKRT
jgi:hypothetical protein